MNIFLNFAGGFFLLVLVILAAAAYRFFAHSADSLERDPDAEPEEIGKEAENEAGKNRKKSAPGISLVKGKLQKEKQPATVLVNMPVLWWKYPGGEWEHAELTQAHTTIGRSEDCDIVLNHPTVSLHHGEIIMKIRTVNAKKQGARYFLLKNRSRENPISYLNEEGGSDDWRDIVGSIPLTYAKNSFFLGLVEMRLMLPAKKQTLSKDPGPEMEHSNPENPTTASENRTTGNSDRQESGQESGPEHRQKPEQMDSANQMNTNPEVIEDEEIARVRQKVIRRSPRSSNRI
jgi:hypothetical protein